MRELGAPQITNGHCTMVGKGVIDIHFSYSIVKDSNVDLGTRGYFLNCPKITELFSSFSSHLEAKSY